MVLKYIEMTNLLFNKKHLKEYVVYGSIAGIFHFLTAWYFLHDSNHSTTFILFVGSIFFMFVIMIYSVKLTRRGPDHESTWGMLIYGAGTFISAKIAYALKSNQTMDLTPEIFEEPAKPENL